MSWTAPRDEDQPASNTAFGAVLDAEALGRVVCNPRHIYKEGGVKPSCFGETDVRERGLSLFRLDHMNPAVQQVQAVAVCSTIPGNRLERVYRSEAASIRALKTASNTQALVILDDPAPASGAVPKNDAHAITRAKEELTEDDLLMIRTELQQLFV